MAKSHLQRAHERIDRVRAENLARQGRTHTANDVPVNDTRAGSVRVSLVIGDIELDLLPGTLPFIAHVCSLIEATTGTFPSSQTVLEIAHATRGDG